MLFYDKGRRGIHNGLEVSLDHYPEYLSKSARPEFCCESNR